MTDFSANAGPGAFEAHAVYKPEDPALEVADADTNRFADAIAANTKEPLAVENGIQTSVDNHSTVFGTLYSTSNALTLNGTPFSHSNREFTENIATLVDSGPVKSTDNNMVESVVSSIFKLEEIRKKAHKDWDELDKSIGEIPIKMPDRGEYEGLSQVEAMRLSTQQSLEFQAASAAREADFQRKLVEFYADVKISSSLITWLRTLATNFVGMAKTIVTQTR